MNLQDVGTARFRRMHARHFVRRESHRDRGITYLEAIVTGPTGEQAAVEFLVDSGATYTLHSLKFSVLEL